MKIKLLFLGYLLGLSTCETIAFARSVDDGNMYLNSSLTVNMTFKGSLPSGSHVFYKLYDMNSQGKIIESAFIQNGNLRFTKEYNILPIKKDQQNIPTNRYKLVVYGVKYNNREVALAYDIEFGGQNIYSSYADYGSSGISILMHGSYSYKVSGIKSEQLTLAVTENKNDSFTDFSNSSSNHCHINGISGLVDDQCTHLREDILVNIAIPYQIDYIPLKNSELNNIEKTYTF